MMLEQTERIDIDGLILNAERNGGRWQFERIQGWRGPAPMSVDQEERANRHGSFAQRGKLTGRIITITGWVFCATRRDAAYATEELSEILSDGQFGRLAVHDIDLGTRWAIVQRIGEFDPEWRDGRGVRFTLQLRAPGAFKYGEDSVATTGFATDPPGAGLRWPRFSPSGVINWGARPTSTGIVTINNPGNATAYPRFTVTGPTPAAGFYILDLATGHRITFTGQVPTSSSLTIDSSNGLIEIDEAADRSGVTVVEGWPTISKRSQASYLFAPIAGTSAATLTAAATATYS